jgi:HlyD family secretion protein
MKGQGKRIALWAVIGLIIAGGLVYAFLPRAVPVDFVTVARAPLIVTIDGEGETRVREVYVLSAPVGGRALRIDVHVGDAVVTGQTLLATIEPEDPAFLDVRSEAQTRAAIEAATAARALASADLQRAEADLAFAEAELGRARQLIKSKTIPQRTLDAAERTQRVAAAAVRTARAAVEMRDFELIEARARLITAASGGSRESVGIPLMASVSGRVLRVLHESEGVVRAGEPLIEIGDPAFLEIVVDLLSSDAVKVVPGQRVMIEEWGGPNPLEGVVRRVEPLGFTKISALGIEEQRVNAIIDITSPQDAWRALGHGYQVDTRIVISEADALSAPLTALFRAGDDWAVFVEAAGRARLRRISVGRLNSEAAEVLDGLSAGERLIAHPTDRVSDGVRVAQRQIGR